MFTASAVTFRGAEGSTDTVQGEREGRERGGEGRGGEGRRGDRRGDWKVCVDLAAHYNLGATP